MTNFPASRRTARILDVIDPFGDPVDSYPEPAPGGDMIVSTGQLVGLCVLMLLLAAVLGVGIWWAM